MPWWLLQKTALSLVKSRLALGSPGWLVVCSVGCYHAQNACTIHHSDHLHRWYPFPDQTGHGMSYNWPSQSFAKLTVSTWHWVLCSFVSLFMWENAHKCLNKRSWRPLPVFLIPNMFGLRLHLPNIRSCLLSSASKYEVPCQPAKSYLDRDLQNRFEFYH